MRRYTVGIDGKQFVIDVKELGAGQFQVQVGGDAFLVELAGEEDLPEAVIRPDVLSGAEPAAAAMVTPVTYKPPPPETLRPLPQVSQPAKPNPKSSLSVDRPESAAGDDEHRGEMRAPMPGTILSIAVQVGDKVTRGQSLLVLEAMKMKNPIRSPRDAVVAAVQVQAGQNVGYGDVLVRFQES